MTCTTVQAVRTRIPTLGRLTGQAPVLRRYNTKANTPVPTAHVATTSIVGTCTVPTASTLPMMTVNSKRSSHLSAADAAFRSDA
jgi:multisubunit Na+/H+ antiporter MnhC subunit